MKLSCCEVEAVHVASLIDILRKKGVGRSRNLITIRVTSLRLCNSRQMSSRKCDADATKKFLLKNEFN